MGNPGNIRHRYTMRKIVSITAEQGVHVSTLECGHKIGYEPGYLSLEESVAKGQENIGKKTRCYECK